ncbi:beta/gamma crystallin domain-containing protein 2 [Bufo bufo]|uniref:beta/gamma crystallin domain-containing protein 2 n=1 Tax=Bufo bufo TaxID=8384 RepID=UPI001ABDEDB3|nr:beta/gamma crystallin domain-containing protein 2 [Bufo bufo]
MSQDQHTPGSPLYPLSRDSHTLQTMEQHEEPDRYRSPLYHCIVSKDLIQEEHVPPVKMPVISSICIETIEQNKQFDAQQTLLCKAKKIEATERTTKQIPLYNSIPVDVAQIRTGQKCRNLSAEAQNNASSFPDPLKLSTEYSLGKKACSKNNRTSLAHRNNLQDGLQKKIHNEHRQVIVHEPAHSLSESSIVSQAKMKDDCKPQQSPNTAKIRYEVIITMTKEEEEQEQLPSLAQELVKAEELVGQDLRMSPSLESQACGCHGAGLTDVTAKEISETSDQTEKNTTQEEEIPENKRGGETPKGPQLNRSIRSTVDEEFFITASGSDQVLKSCRPYPTNMEKPDNQQNVFELPRSSNKKDNDFAKLSYGHVSPQLYVGHVKGLQKVFENISTKDNVIHHKETPKSQQYGSLREKKHKVPQDMPATPGFHGPVYSKVYNPLRKDNLEKRNEHVIVTVIDGSEKSDTPVSTIPMDSNRKCLETKSSAKKYIGNVELTNRYHSGNEANYRKARAQLPDLNLSPRIPTPPPYRTRNNVSISLSSPRGWKNESVRSPMSSVAQRFENQRNNFSPNPSQTSANFFFSGGSISHAKSSSELQQNVIKFEENLIQPRDITKSYHAKNSQASNTVDLKSLSTANISHVVSRFVDEKEAIHSKSFEALVNTISNEIQEDSTVNDDSGLVDIQERFNDKHVAKRILIEDRHYEGIGTLDMKDLKSRGKEVCVQETMNTSTIDSHLGQGIPPMITPKRKPPDYSHNAYINHKLKHTLKKKLVDSNDLNKHNASHCMDLNYTAVNSMPVENRDYIGRDLHANQKVKNKHQPTIILCTFVNQVDHDSINLTKRTNNDEIWHYGASLSDQPLEEETKMKLKHEAELKNKHAEFIQCDVKNNSESSTNTLYEYQSTTIVNQGKPLSDQSEGEVFTILSKGEDTVDLVTNITSSADNNEEGKTDVPERADGDVSSVTLNKEVIESQIELQEMDISEDYNGFEQPVEDIKMDKIEKMSIMQNDKYLTKVTKDAPFNKEVIESHIRQQEIDVSEDNAFEQPLGDIQMDQVEKVAIMQNDTYLTEVTEDAPLNKEVIESHIEQPEIDISEDYDFVLNKAEDKTLGELSNTEYNNHKIDKEVNNQELHYIVSVTTIDGQMDYVNEFKHNQILRNGGSVDILEQAENEEAQLTDQLVNNVKDGSSLAEDKSKYEQNITANDLLSTDSNPNTVGSNVMGHGQNVEVSVEIKCEHMENVSDISENSTVVKNTVTVIQEKTNKMDINTVDMTDQSILIAAVAEDEPVTHETHLFANDMTVSTEVEQSKEIIKIAESKDPAAQEVIVLVDSSIEISEQTFNNFKEDPDNMLNTDVNANHMSDTHVLYNNTAQTGDVIVDYNNQNADLLSERHENGAEQALDVISQFVNNKVIETTILVSEEDCGIFTDDKDKVIIQLPVNEFVDETSELVNDQAEQNGHISSAEGLTVDNSNSTGEAAQSTLRQSDKTQNISHLLGQNTSLTGENEENDSLNGVRLHIFVEKVIEQPLVEIQMNQVEKVAVMQNDKCLTKVTEDAVYDKEDALEPHAKKIDMTNEIHEHTWVKITNDILTCIDSKNSLDDQPSENTQMGKDIANHVADEISQWKGLDDNLLLSEQQAEHLNDQSPTLYSSGMQTTSQLPETNEFQRRKNIDTHESNFYSSLNKLNGNISGISLLDVEKNNPANHGNMSSANTIDPQIHQNSVEQTTRIFQHFHLTNSENNLNDATLTEHARNCAEEEEADSSENMEMWLSKLRQLETPEFMKHLREPRQPRCSALSMYATLPPIKEDQASPKSDCFDFRVALPEIKENKITPEEGESTVEPNIVDQTEKSEEDENKYSWERNTESSKVRSSPLELMRKHSGDEGSRSDSYKAFIAQNISQRQSSIIGSLLLSEKLDKKTDTSEGKSYSRLESSFLLSSYLKPEKDKLGVTKETETVSENSISENDTDTATTNDTLTSTTRDPKQEDNVDGSIPKVNRITEIDSTERPSKLDIPVSTPFKVFPDVWHHPGKSHGKLNPRPGKIILFSESGFRGHGYEIYSDVGNACEWELQGKISVRIIRGGWLLYEKPYFRGRRVMLLEGDTDLTCPWKDKSSKDPQRDTTKPKSWIGSLRHMVRDFQVPRISLFLDENGEGNKITILGAASDSCVNGKPIKTESIIVHSGLWLVYSKPFFEGDPYILEPGGYPNRNAWNGHDSHLCSLQPARIGGPTVEKPNEPKILVFQHPELKGHSWGVTRDLHSLQGEPNQQGERLTSVGSLKVLGGCWVAYEKEGFHGHQYLLEEGEYQKWSQWGGCTEELGSLRLIRTDFSEPEIILYEKPGCLEGSCLRLNEALADIEVADYGTSTGSIQVLNGVWVAYENVDFSGEQYILEKGIYHSYHDWGAKDSQICAVQPVLQVGGQSLQYLSKIQLFSEPNFHGDCMTHTEDHILLPKTFSPQSCRIEGGSWVLYEGEDCCGEQFILVEGDYPTRTAMGCQAISVIQSLKKVPLYFSIPSISLHGLERFEGKELEFTGTVRSLQGEGYNNHVMSVKVASGIWVLYEHSDFRGRQWLLQQTQITNWLLFSGTQRIGSLCPIRQTRVYFRLRNHALGLFLCVSEPAENIKAARVQVSEPREGSCDLWYYEEGRIKNQMTPQMSLQVVGMTSPGTKVVMWSEGRKPIQTWTIEDTGLIMSCLFEGLCLDIKGGHSYDSDHVVVWETAEDRLTQRWDLEVF